MSNGASIAPLSGSQGGAPILLDNITVPGKLIHENPADSGVIARVVDVLVGNPNPQQITLGVATVGPGVPAPSQFEDMIRIDVPPTAEGTVVRIFYTPFVLASGYSYYISTKLNQGDRPPYLYGYVENFASQGVLGYGGLIQRTAVAMPDIPAGQWQTIPVDEGQVTNPVNVVQDPANDRLQINAPGIWWAAVHGTLEFNKQGGQDRVIYWRLFDETSGTSILPDPFPVNAEDGTNHGMWSASVLYEVLPELVGNWIRWELGGSSAAFSGITLQKAGVALVRISPTI